MGLKKLEQGFGVSRAIITNGILSLSDHYPAGRLNSFCPQRVVGIMASTANLESNPDALNSNPTSQTLHRKPKPQVLDSGQ